MTKNGREIAAELISVYSTSMCIDNVVMYTEIFAGAKFHGNAYRLFKRNFRSFYFRGGDALTTPLSVDGHVPHANQRNNTEQRSE